MNSNDRRHRRLRSIVPACALLLAACGQGNDAAPADNREPPLAGARIGGPFALVAPDGRTVRDSDFSGKWRIVYFGYTYCPDVCPVDLQAIAGGLKLIEKDDAALAARIVPIFITIDPERDTREVMGRYAAAFHPRLVALTGSADAIAATARAYGAYFAKRASKDSTEYLMDHSRVAYLMDPDGKPVAMLPSDESPQAVAAELRRWVR